MSKRFWIPLAMAGLLAGMTACGGGGGGGSSATPVATIAPSQNTSSNCTGVSPSCGTYAVTSSPSGLTVTLDGATAGTTPVTLTPTLSSSPHTVVVDPNGGKYTVTINQTQSGNHSIFYNKAADTSGTVSNAGQVAVTSALRSTQSVTPGAAARMPQHFAGAPGVSQSMVYVRYNTATLNAAGRRAADVESALGVRTSMTIAASGTEELHAVAVPAGQAIDAFSNSLRGQTGVESVEPVHLRYAATASAQTPSDCHYSLQNGVVPNLCGTKSGTLSVASDQWDFGIIGAPNAWGYFNPPFGSKNVKIAIIDTGYDCAAASNVNDLAANVVFAEGIINGNVGTGCNSASGTSPGVLDTDGHGTNVSGIADAVTDNSLGFAGVAANAQLYEYRIFPQGLSTSANTSDEAAAINDAVSRGVQVINLSLGSPQGTGADSGEETAIENAINAGVTVVAAAGNETATTVDYPGAYPGVISVGATSLADGQPNGRGNSNGSSGSPVEYIASYSNYGIGLGLVAPGGDPVNSNDGDALHWITNLYSTADTTSQCSPSQQPDGVCVSLFAGTSQATPHVTGAAALLIAANGSSLTPYQVAQYLESSADDICSQSAYSCPAGPAMEGHGRLDVYRAISALKGQPFPQATPQGNQYVAFAYTGTLTTGTTIVNSSGSSSVILDLTYPTGVPVSSSGTFRIGDLPTSVTGPWKIGVWYNTAGNGVLTNGDLFGVATCSGQAACSASNIQMQTVNGQSF